MSEPTTPLGKSMQRLAAECEKDVAYTLGILTNDFETAIASGDAKKILGAWARARRVYCHFSGEELV